MFADFHSPYVRNVEYNTHTIIDQHTRGLFHPNMEILVGSMKSYLHSFLFPLSLNFLHLARGKEEKRKN